MRIECEGRGYGGLIVLEHRAGAVSPTAVDGFALTPVEKFVGTSLLGFLRGHPCIGARSLAGKAERRSDAQTGQWEPAHQGLHYAVYPDMHSVQSALMFLTDFEHYGTRSDPIDPILKTLAAVFIAYVPETQAEFSEAYWKFAQLLSDISALTHDWPVGIGSDPRDQNFELCLAGRPVFTTTLNLASPRLARRYFPTWVMNQTAQFDALRADGSFKRWQDSIRKSDAASDPSGTSNPILENHGEASAAPQLAGSPPAELTFSVPDKTQIVARGEALLQRAVSEGAHASAVRELKRRIDAARVR